MKPLRRLFRLANANSKTAEEDTTRNTKPRSALYKPLDESKDEIRLLLVKPAKRLADPIQCKMKIEPLKKRPKYGALSYVWGDPQKSKHIFINSVQVGVAENLFSALQNLRLPSKILTIWIDAVCIDQDDDIERNSQVSQMHNIFASADMVHAWLGPECDASRETFEMIHDWTSALNHGTKGYSDMIRSMDLELEEKLKWKRDFESKLEQDISFANACSSDQRLRSLSWMIDNSYWTRLWIQQELCLARRVEIQSGQGKITLGRYVRFNISLDLIYGLYDASAPNMVPIPSFYDPIKLFQSVRYDHLPELVYRSRIFRCSDERDHIYGVLGIYNGRHAPVAVRYDHSVEEVFVEFFLWTASNYEELLIDGSNGMDVWIGSELRLKHLPSWAPNFAIITIDHLFLSRTRLIGAAGGTKPCFHFDRELLSLETRAFVVDRVKAQKPFGKDPVAAREANLMLFLKGVLQNNRRDATYVLKALYMSISSIVFRGNIPRNYAMESLGVCAWILLWPEQLPQSEYHPKYVEFREAYNLQEDHLAPEVEPLVRFLQLTGSVEVAKELCDVYGVIEGLTQLAEHRNLGPYWANLMGVPVDNQFLRTFNIFHARDDFLKTLSMLLISWSLFVTQNGYIGKGSSSLIEGDEVCIIPGCRQPVIIRKAGENYEVIDAPPIHGMMDGEVMKLAQEGMFEERTIRLI
ncbi:heterokaryon incompatibility protein-domain-containing protein [Lophiotrema nucula]|uniref:Heterokaryon incompatibility protein-domain-containing protein n=1 Tax=Lophiotrema nucula TaxID=690887 RepID=A0A6A5ZV03_9PLEO|nr:heterokaryon incompatibility protein-domain-containing protein [Lophiotrema nucula]